MVENTYISKPHNWLTIKTRSFFYKIDSTGIMRIRVILATTLK